jgi:uncharacterized protein (TIGR03435 family)
MARTSDSIPGLVAMIAAAIFGLTSSGRSSASASQIQPAPLSFDVASIKARDPQIPLGLVGLQRLPGRLTSRCVSLKSLVFYAYGLTLSSPIGGLPGWADAPCIDGTASDTYEVQATMPPDTTDAQAREMMQTLLADRFKLTVHRETRDLPVFALVIAQGGFKLKPSDPKDDPPGFIQCPPDDPQCRVFGGGSGPISDLAGLVSLSVGRPVVDKTGLSGTYRLDLRWAGDALNSSLPSLPTALRETFGLELKPDTGPVQVLVIDHAEKPSAN